MKALEQVLGVVLIAAAMIVVGGAAEASAAVTRYAAPGGISNPDLCDNPSPLALRCTIAAAAAGSGVLAADSVVIAPGNYSDTAGDLGGTGTVTPVANDVHGVAGQPRPVIELSSAGAGAFNINSGTSLSHIEIDTAVSITNVASSGLINDLIARSSVAAATVCKAFDSSIFSNSACLATGADATAFGAGDSYKPDVTNVTAISSGTGATRGIAYHGTTTITHLTSVIARASATGIDVEASSPTGTFTGVSVTHSNYQTTATGGDDSISDTGGHQTTAPRLAADGYHQLSDSAGTIDLGQTTSLLYDIDGQARTVTATDIGADELQGNQTTTALACAPASLALGSGAATCAATVTDATLPFTTPTGRVNFSSSGPGSFSGAESCAPAGIGAGQARCQLAYTPNALGTGIHQITSVYSGDNTIYDSSQGTASLGVTSPPVATAVQAIKKKCKKHRKLRRGKCVKKKRKK